MTVTETKTASRRPVARPAPPRRPVRPSVLLPGAVAAAWALAAGLISIAVPVLIAWAADSRTGAGATEALQTAGQLWLLAHGATLRLVSGAVGLTPLGLAALPLLLLHRAGRHGARTVQLDGPRHAAALVVATAFPYAVAAGFLSALCSTKAIAPDPVTALLGGFVVGLLGVGSGVVRQSALWQPRRLPVRARAALGGGAGAVAVLLAGGALLAGLSLAAHAGRASTLADATDPGLAGGIALLLVGLLLIPNAAVWGASFVAGPGFAVGVGTSVGPFATSLGPVPALPLLAALPSGEVPVWLSVVVLLVPVAAGIVAGRLAVRRLPTTSSLTAAWEAALAGPVAGAALALLAWRSGGPLGGSRLADVGPSPWKVGLAVLLEVALPAAATAALVVHRRRRAALRP